MSFQTDTSKSPSKSQENVKFRSHSDNDGACRAITESGSTCGESKSLRIIDEIQQLYQERLRRIDEVAGGDGTQLKVRTLTAWVNDLGEQNTMLVKTVEQLEREACDRVALLEDQLQRSSRTALEYMTKLQDYDQQLNEATGAKVRSESMSIKSSSQLAVAQQTEEMLRVRVCNLQNDIGCLLEMIRRARVDGSWRTDGLNFCEVTFEDIFGSQSYQGSDLSKSHDVNTMTELTCTCFELEADLWKKAVSETENQLLQTKSELRRLENDTHEQQMELMGVTKRLQDMDVQHNIALMERQDLADEVALLSTQLREKTSQLETLIQSGKSMEKSTKDMREALTAEVAEKHDQILALRREAQQLEERCRQADMQTHFRDDIIKEMRKDIKIAKSKLATLENRSGNTVHDESLTHRLGAASQPAFKHYQPLTGSQEKSEIPHHHKDQSHSTLNLYDFHCSSERPSHLVSDTLESAPSEKNTRTSLKTRGSPEKLLRSRKNLKPQLEEANSRLAYIPEMGDHLAAECYYEIRRRSSPPNRDPDKLNVSRSVQVGPPDGQKHHSTQHPSAWSRKSK